MQIFFLVLKQVFHGVATLIQMIKLIILETTRVNAAWEHNAKFDVSLTVHHSIDLFQ